MRTDLAPPDEELVERYLENGCADSLDELLGRHLVRIRRLVRSIVLDDSAADDVTQEAFLRAFRNLTRFRASSQFSTWLYRIAVNVARTHLEQKNRRGQAVPTELAETASDDPAPGHALELNELEQEIESAMASLSPKLRTAIVLIAIEGRTPGEAAAIEGCSLATMYWRLHAGRKQLKRHLARHLT